MDDKKLEKIHILLKHWIDHNKDHVKGYISWGQELEDANFKKAAKELETVVNLSKEITIALAMAIENLPQPKNKSDNTGEHGHHHH